MQEQLKVLKKYKALLYELVNRDIKVRYKGSVLGMLWTVLNPILTMFVMTIVFSKLFRFEIEYYPIYFFCGHILYQLMSESTTNAMHSILDNSSLIKKVYVPKYLFPVSKIMSSVVNLLFSFLAMIIIMLILGAPFKVTILLSFVPIIYVIVFSMGLGLILSTIMVFFKDMGQLYSVITLLWMYLTPLFYPVSVLKENVPIMLVINPMYHYIQYFRNLVLYGKIPGVMENITCIIISGVVFVLGLVLFRKKQDKFILHI